MPFEAEALMSQAAMTNGSLGLPLPPTTPLPGTKKSESPSMTIGGCSVYATDVPRTGGTLVNSKEAASKAATARAATKVGLLCAAGLTRVSARSGTLGGIPHVHSRIRRIDRVDDKSMDDLTPQTRTPVRHPRRSRNPEDQQ